MKTKLIISAVLAAALLFLNPISFAANNNCSGRACSASSQIKTAQDKAADAGKKNSTIESSQKTGSVLFDGVDPNLPAKDFDPDSSNPAALTGGGLLLDLKAAEPDLSKVSPLTDFSLENKPTLEFAKTALLPQKAEAASNDVYDACVNLRRAAIELSDKEIKMYEDAELTYQNVLTALMKGEGVCAPASVALNPKDCSDGISVAEEGIKNMQAGIENARAKKNNLPTKIESCGCPPGTNPVNGECRAEQEPETEDGLEPPAWPYGWLDWAGIIAALVGVGLLAAGLSLGGLALLVISVIALIVGFIKGQREAEEWARKQAIKNKKKEIKRTIDSLRNAGYDSLSDFQGTGIVPENDDLRKMGFTDEDIQELEDYARGTQ